jgi:hypothetical protein
MFINKRLLEFNTSGVAINRASFTTDATVDSGI